MSGQRQPLIILFLHSFTSVGGITCPVYSWTENKRGKQTAYFSICKSLDLWGFVIILSPFLYFLVFSYQSIVSEIQWSRGRYYTLAKSFCKNLLAFQCIKLRDKKTMVIYWDFCGILTSRCNILYKYWLYVWGFLSVLENNFLSGGSILLSSTACLQNFKSWARWSKLMRSSWFSKDTSSR